ncbi:hypothetical protein RhiJN_05518 [Ceratobasidium sp. AG-Ba]|nr:hypothetical protein RhiJN_05518 [Ceratobasidium sp. AG-Ba]QRW06446.1 hypothetical protein RhiLY_05445 [Ceratobasidium sp. AG-Ba]
MANQTHVNHKFGGHQTLDVIHLGVDATCGFELPKRVSAHAPRKPPLAPMNNQSVESSPAAPALYREDDAAPVADDQRAREALAWMERVAAGAKRFVENDTAIAAATQAYMQRLDDLVRTRREPGDWATLSDGRAQVYRMLAILID